MLGLQTVQGISQGLATVTEDINVLKQKRKFGFSFPYTYYPIPETHNYKVDTCTFLNCIIARCIEKSVFS